MSKTTKEYVEYVAIKLSSAGVVRTRSMMGGYLVYLDEVLIGQINEGHLYVKMTSSGEKYAKHFKKVSPYPGAKPAYEVADSDLDGEWMIDFLRGTRNVLKK